MPWRGDAGATPSLRRKPTEAAIQECGGLDTGFRRYDVFGGASVQGAHQGRPYGGHDGPSAVRAKAPCYNELRGIRLD